MVVEASEIILNAEVDSTTRRVTVTGVAADTRANYIVVTVLKPSSGNQSNNDIYNGLSEMEYMSKVYTTYQVKLATDNSFEFNYVMDNQAEQGWYSVYISGQGLNALDGRMTQYFYVNEYRVRHTIELLNGNEDDDFENLLTQIGIVLGNDYDKVKDRTKALFYKIRDSLGGFDTLGDLESIVNNVRDVFDEAKALSLLDSVDSDNVQGVLDQYQACLKLNLNGDYEIVAQDIGKLFTAVKRDESITIDSKAKLSDVLNKSIALAVLNISDRTSIHNVLTRYNHIFKLNLDGKYKEIDKLAIGKALAFSGFTKISVVQSSFEDAVSELYKQQSKPIPSGGGGGGGGGRTSVYEVANPVSDDTKEIKPEQVFDDLEDVSWAKESILAFAQEGIVSGVDGKSFMPNKTVTREEFIKILVMALGLDKTDISQVSKFNDISENDWYHRYILIAKQLGIITGKEDGSFGVGESLTRQDLATICYRAALKSGKIFTKSKNASSFIDFNQINEYAKDAVMTLSEVGIINGVGNNEFAPEGTASRAQAVKIMYMIRGYSN